LLASAIRWGRQEERRHPPDGGGQQGFCPLQVV